MAECGHGVSPYQILISKHDFVCQKKFTVLTEEVTICHTHCCSYLLKLLIFKGNEETFSATLLAIRNSTCG